LRIRQQQVMALGETFLKLSAAGQREVHLRLCEEALVIWEAWAAGQRAIVYYDSVVGVRHKVDVRLPHDALRAARAGIDTEGVWDRYLEPTVAMQDDDLVFPKPIEFAYYAIYNCFRKHARSEDIDAWLIVNQALAADEDETEWTRRLVAAIEVGSR
jgi:hypothetical protein